jgi:hypothetical protein
MHFFEQHQINVTFLSVEWRIYGSHLRSHDQGEGKLPTGQSDFEKPLQVRAWTVVCRSEYLDRVAVGRHERTEEGASRLSSYQLNLGLSRVE